jgi:cytosine/adenosine deaminase-related metal-dependent hydrolase
MKIINAWISQVKNQTIEPLYGGLEITDGKISSIIKQGNEATISTSDGDPDVINADGRLLTIPQINFHDHFYSRLAKGLPIIGEMNNFHNILKNLWWKLDMELDTELVEVSAQMAVLESVRQGTIYIFDHHSSPNYSSGSLKMISKVMKGIGLRGVLCFETTDRNGDELALGGIEENESFMLNHADEDIKSLLGLHASFTLSDNSLTEASKLIEKHKLGIHIHLCEDKIDKAESMRIYKLSPVERLKKFNLLNDKSILSHGIHLDEDDYKIISDYGCAIAYNPESNMNNNVGLPKLRNIPENIPILSGTDGMHSNPSRSLKQTFLLCRNSGMSFEDSFAFIIRIFFNQLGFVKKYFFDFTSLKEGDRADFILWDYIPPTPITEENYWGHFIFGALERPVHSVVQNGNALMKDFNIGFDEKKYYSNIINNGRRLYNNLLKK